MSFAAAVKSVYRKYAAFEGRARRAEFWYFYLFEIIVMVPLYGIGLASLALGGGLSDSTSSTGTSTAPASVPLIVLGAIALVLFSVFALATLIPRLAVTVRRLHDTGRSGWWIFISYVPFVGGILLLVWLASSGEYGPNRFGGDPKNPAAVGPGGYPYPAAPIGGPQYPYAPPQY